MELSESEWKQLVVMAWDTSPCVNTKGTKLDCQSPSCSAAAFILKLNEKHYPKSRRTWSAYLRSQKPTKEVK